MPRGPPKKMHSGKSSSIPRSLQAPGSDSALYHSNGFARRGTLARVHVHGFRRAVAVTGYIRRPIKRAK